MTSRSHRWALSTPHEGYFDAISMGYYPNFTSVEAILQFNLAASG